MCLACILRLFLWHAFGAGLEVELAERSTLCIFIGIDSVLLKVSLLSLHFLSPDLIMVSSEAFLTIDNLKGRVPVLHQVDGGRGGTLAKNYISVE